MDQRIPRPRALTILMWFTGIYAVGAALGIGAVVAGFRHTSIGGLPVTREVWLAVAAPLVGVVAVLMGLTSIGLHRHRAWARTACMCIWPMIGIYGLLGSVRGTIPWSLVWRAVIDATLFGAIAVWLLFWSKPSAAYFKQIKVAQVS